MSSTFNEYLVSKGAFQPRQPKRTLPTNSRIAGRRRRVRGAGASAVPTSGRP